MAKRGSNNIWEGRRWWKDTQTNGSGFILSWIQKIVEAYKPFGSDGFEDIGAANCAVPTVLWDVFVIWARFSEIGCYFVRNQQRRVQSKLFPNYTGDFGSE